VIAGAVVGGVIYGILFFLTERALVKKVLGLVRKRQIGAATEASSA
jgi:succinoglycan exporter